VQLMHTNWLSMLGAWLDSNFLGRVWTGESGVAKSCVKIDLRPKWCNEEKQSHCLKQPQTAVCQFSIVLQLLFFITFIIIFVIDIACNMPSHSICNVKPNMLLSSVACLSEISKETINEIKSVHTLVSVWFGLALGGWILLQGVSHFRR